MTKKCWCCCPDQLITSCSSWRCLLWIRALSWRWRWRGSMLRRSRGSGCRCHVSYCTLTPIEVYSWSRIPSVIYCDTLPMRVFVSCSQTDTTVYQTVLSHPMALCEIHTIELKNTGARFYRQSDVHVKSVCLSEFPSLRYGTCGTVWPHTLLFFLHLKWHLLLLFLVKKKKKHKTFQMRSYFRREQPLCVNNFNVRRGAPWSHDFVQVCDFWGSTVKSIMGINWNTVFVLIKKKHTHTFYLVKEAKMSASHSLILILLTG